MLSDRKSSPRAHFVGFQPPVLAFASETATMTAETWDFGPRNCPNGQFSRVFSPLQRKGV